MPRKANPTHLPHGKGRLKVEWPPVPPVPEYRLRAVAEWLSEHRNVRRPLSVATPLLATVCALYELERPLPTRRALAEAFGCNIFSIDGAISTALGEDEIREEYRYTPGEVANRSSIKRRRYLLPSEQLLSAYQSVARTRSTNATPPGGMKLAG